MSTVSANVTTLIKIHILRIILRALNANESTEFNFSDNKVRNLWNNPLLNCIYTTSKYSKNWEKERVIYHYKESKKCCTRISITFQFEVYARVVNKKWISIKIFTSLARWLTTLAGHGSNTPSLWNFLKIIILMTTFFWEIGLAILVRFAWWKSKTCTGF